MLQVSEQYEVNLKYSGYLVLEKCYGKIPFGICLFIIWKVSCIVFHKSIINCPPVMKEKVFFLYVQKQGFILSDKDSSGGYLAF